MQQYLEYLVCDAPRITVNKFNTENIEDYSMLIAYPNGDCQEIDIPESVYYRMAKYINNEEYKNK